jgi:hypothetical protein
MKRSSRSKHRITLSSAKDLVLRYRTFARELGGIFPRSEIERLLAQPDCEALRFYFGMHEDGSPALVLVGADRKGEDLYAAGVLEEHLPCPPVCSATSALGPRLKAGTRRR